MSPSLFLKVSTPRGAGPFGRVAAARSPGVGAGAPAGAVPDPAR